MLESIRNSLYQEKRNVNIEEVAGKNNINIYVVGVGGAGCNCVNRIHRAGIRSAKTVAINTDLKHLNIIQADKKILIGRNITRGLGAGGYPHVAKKCAESDVELLRKELGEPHLVFLVAGMGGGTGTGAAPTVARLLKETGAIVVGMVTYPFKIERARLKIANKGIEELKKEVDTLVVIDNNRLYEYAPNLPMDKSFELADSITGRAVKGISDTIVFQSLLNIDYADVRATMSNGGIALISLGEGTGPNRVEEAIESTLKHPLLDVDYEGAKGALIHLEGGPDLTLKEATDVAGRISEHFDENASVKLGARICPETQGKIKVTAIIVGVKSPMMFSNEQKKDDDDFTSLLDNL